MNKFNYYNYLVYLSKLNSSMDDSPRKSIIIMIRKAVHILSKCSAFLF